MYVVLDEASANNCTIHEPNSIVVARCKQ
jgi:hypothetical protein